MWTLPLQRREISRGNQGIENHRGIEKQLDHASTNQKTCQYQYVINVCQHGRQSGKTGSSLVGKTKFYCKIINFSSMSRERPVQQKLFSRKCASIKVGFKCNSAFCNTCLRFEHFLQPHGLHNRQIRQKYTTLQAGAKRHVTVSFYLAIHTTCFALPRFWGQRGPILFLFTWFLFI